MQIQGRSLVFNGVTIKAKEGSISDNLLNFSEKDSAVYVGNLKFPLARYNKFDPDSNGFLKVDGNYLILTYNYEQFTLNTVTFKTEKNEGEGQQATFTVQNGDQSFILTNAVEQEQTVKWTGQPIIVTAINYATGAIDSKTVTPQPGQVYRLSSTSESYEEGELKTVGGELISGGELKTVCVQKGFDIVNAPVLYYSEDVFTPEQDFIGPYRDQAQVATGYSLYLANVDGAYATKLSSIRQVLVANPYFQFVKPNGTVEKLHLDADNMVKATFTGTHRFITGVVNNTSIGLFDVTLQEDKYYYILFNRSFMGLRTSIQDNGIVQTMYDVAYQAKILGPMDRTCLQTQIIDTRYSYTTPVVTTDTRRTVNTISLTISELN